MCDYTASASHSIDLHSVEHGTTKPATVCGYHLFANPPADLWQNIRS